MSQIARAKQRIMMRSNSIPQAQQIMYRFDRQDNRKMTPSPLSNLKLQSIENSPKSRYLYVGRDQDNLSPQFARTQRFYKRDINEDDMMSEYKPPPESYRPRRNTNISSSNLNENARRSSLGLSDKKENAYNQFANQNKKTVRSQKLSLVIAPVSVRLSQSPVKPKECLNEIVQKQLEEQRQNGEGYKDYIFPARQSIMFTKRTQFQEQGLAFERLVRLYESNIIKIVEFSQPSYLIQGKYTSPAVYSALAILAEDPTRLANIFYSQIVNQMGMYYLHLCKDGVWRYIVIDDYVPIKVSVKRSLLFLHSAGIKNTYQIWPCLIQKALAKIYGTYQDLQMCMDLGIRDIFRILTGYPVSQYYLDKDFRSYLILIDNALKKKQIVVLEKVHPYLQQIATERKISIYKSYLVVEAKKNSITIRNLDDQAQLITKLSLEEAMMFSKLLIFRNEKNYVYISQTLRHKKTFYSTLHIKVTTETKCYMDIWENNPVYYKKHLNSNSNYKVSKYQIRIKVLQESNDDVEEDILTESGKQIILKPATYQIAIHLCQWKEQDFTFSYYGEQQIEIKRFKNSQKWNQSKSENCQCIPE